MTLFMPGRLAQPVPPIIQLWKVVSTLSSAHANVQSLLPQREIICPAIANRSFLVRQEHRHTEA